MVKLTSTVNRFENRLPAFVEVMVLSKRYCHLPIGALLRTTRGLSLFDALALHGRARHLAGGLGLLVTVLAALVGIVTVLRFGQSSLATSAPTVVHDPANMVVAPGVNDFMPWSAAGAIALAVAFIALTHEAGHGIMARSVGIDVESWGVLVIGVFPIGAFVEPDEEQVEAAQPLPRLYFAVGGILANLAVAIPAAVAHVALVPPEAILGALTGGGDISSVPASFSGLLAAQSPIVNVLFWVWFLGVNVILVNALPIRGLDGGHVLRGAWELVVGAVPPVGSVLPTGRVLHWSTSLLLGIFATGMAAPWLRAWGWV